MTQSCRFHPDTDWPPPRIRIQLQVRHRQEPSAWRKFELQTGTRPLCRGLIQCSTFRPATGSSGSICAANLAWGTQHDGQTPDPRTGKRLTASYGSKENGKAGRNRREMSRKPASRARAGIPDILKPLGEKTRRARTGGGIAQPVFITAPKRQKRGGKSPAPSFVDWNRITSTRQYSVGKRLVARQAVHESYPHYPPQNQDGPVPVPARPGHERHQCLRQVRPIRPVS